MLLPNFKFFDKWKKNDASVQRNTFDSDEEVVRLLKRLQQHLVIITAKFHSDPETYNTSIIKVDYKKNYFIWMNWFQRQAILKSKN